MLNVNEIPPETGSYFAGFTDGEGSFNVSFRPRNDYRFPWKISLCFNISQRDEVILAQFKRHLRCGMMRQGQHLTREGVEEILRIRSTMNDGGNRRYNDAEILKQLENPQRPYARPEGTISG